MNTPTRNCIILVDTNAIKEAHNQNCWNALKNRYSLHTVQECIDEATRTSKRGRRLVNREAEDLAKDFARVETISDLARAKLMLEIGNRNDVDAGERDLLAYACSLVRQVWWLCGPDNGTVHAMRTLKLFERMVSLEAIGQACGHNFSNLPQNYSERWLSNHRTNFLFEDC